jgi:heme-degrading monooxygenase HmoA
MSQFIAMNRFQVVSGHEKEFEDIWRSRTSFLENVSGFKKFSLLKGPGLENSTIYASHTLWESEIHFENWTKSESFRKAHEGAGARRHLYLDHPHFEGFQVVKGTSISSK